MQIRLKFKGLTEAYLSHGIPQSTLLMGIFLKFEIVPCQAGSIEFPDGGTTSEQIKFSWSPSTGGVDQYKAVVKGGGKFTCTLFSIHY